MGLSRPEQALKVVVLPAPFGPISPVMRAMGARQADVVDGAHPAVLDGQVADREAGLGRDAATARRADARGLLAALCARSTAAAGAPAASSIALGEDQSRGPGHPRRSKKSADDQGHREDPVDLQGEGGGRDPEEIGQVGVDVGDGDVARDEPRGQARPRWRTTDRPITVMTTMATMVSEANEL